VDLGEQGVGEVMIWRRSIVELVEGIFTTRCYRKLHSLRSESVPLRWWTLFR
jgi:hypothetical protein